MTAPCAFPPFNSLSWSETIPKKCFNQSGARAYQPFMLPPRLRNRFEPIDVSIAPAQCSRRHLENGAVKVAKFLTQAGGGKSFRAALLGAVAVVAAGGLTIEALPLASYPAFAAASAPSAGPASFADVVDHVKGAVVSVKVKIDQSKVSFDEDSQPETQPMPNMPKGGPMERFFRQFGAPGSGSRG